MGSIIVCLITKEELLFLTMLRIKLAIMKIQREITPKPLTHLVFMEALIYQVLMMEID